MNIKWILIAISILIIAGPVSGALVIYRDNLAALIVPETPEFLTNMPEFEYVGYQSTNPLKPILKFEIENPYNIDLKLNSINAKVFCSDHNTFLGYASENVSVIIPAKSSANINILINFTSPSDIYTNHSGKNDLYIDFGELTFDIQGVKIHYEGTMSSHIGPLPTP